MSRRRTTMTMSRIRRAGAMRGAAAFGALLLMVVSPAVCKAIVCPLVMSASCAADSATVEEVVETAGCAPAAVDSCEIAPAVPSCDAAPCGMTPRPSCSTPAPTPAAAACGATSAQCDSDSASGGDASGCPQCLPCDLEHFVLVPVPGQTLRGAAFAPFQSVVTGLLAPAGQDGPGVPTSWLTFGHHPPWRPPGGAASLRVLLCCYRC